MESRERMERDVESSHGSRFSGLVSHVALISRASTNDRDVGVMRVTKRRARQSFITGALADSPKSRAACFNGTLRIGRIDRVILSAPRRNPGPLVDENKINAA